MGMNSQFEDTSLADALADALADDQVRDVTICTLTGTIGSI
jgi:hypothetical protein